MQSLTAPTRVPRTEWDALAAQFDGRAVVAITPTQPNSQFTFVIPRSFALRCAIYAAATQSDEATEALQGDDTTADDVSQEACPSNGDAEHRRVGFHRLHIDEPSGEAGTVISGRIIGDCTAVPPSVPLRSSDAPSRASLNRATHREVDVLPLPPTFNDEDVAELAHYASIPATPSNRLDGAQIALDGPLPITDAERKWLERLEERARARLPLPAVKPTAMVADPLPEPGATVLRPPLFVRPPADDLPRLDVVLRMAALADYLGHKDLQTLLAYHVALALEDRPVPDIRVILHPQLRLVPRAVYTSFAGPTAADANGVGATPTADADLVTATTGEVHRVRPPVLFAGETLKRIREDAHVTQQSAVDTMQSTWPTWS